MTYHSIFNFMAALSLVVFAETAGAAKAISVEKFNCSGPNLSGVITIVNYEQTRADLYYSSEPPYTSIAQLHIAGRGNVVLKNHGYRTYFKRKLNFSEGGWSRYAVGMWVYDKSRIIYSLGGYELRLNRRSNPISDNVSDVLRLQVDQGRRVWGYLGHRDQDSNRGTREFHDYDFECQRR